MGTASTMARMSESLGMTLPTNAAIPGTICLSLCLAFILFPDLGADARRYTLAHLTGSRIVQMVKDDLRMSKVTQQTFGTYINKP